MRVMANAVPPALAATAQAIYAFAPAALTALLVWASGWLYGGGPWPFLAMAGLCLLALPIARLGVPARDKYVRSGHLGAPAPLE
jgi:hypothetical protein